MISMTVWQAIIAGVVQGVTELLPVSSSGHLIFLRSLFGNGVDSLSFDVALHVATLAAIIWVLRQDVIHIIREFFSKQILHSVGLKIAVATIPAVLLGLYLHGERLEVVRTTHVIGISLIVWGVVLYAADVYLSKKGAVIKRLERIGWVRPIMIGLAQAIALIPGTSRSGITMSMALFSRIDRVRAAKFSFLLSIPAILGAAVFSVIDVAESGLDTSWSALIVGALAAFISGALVIKYFLAYLQKGTLLWFVVYRILLGGLLLILF